MPLCEGGMSFKGSTLSTPTPANIRSFPCCNEESKRAARRILVERSTGKHRSLPSATGRFVLMICSRVPSFFSSPPVFFPSLPEGLVHVFICSNLLVYHNETAEQTHFHNRIHLPTSSCIRISCSLLAVIADLNSSFVVWEIITWNMCLRRI